jgi:esterase/lipase superfamily enzyme
MSFLVRGCSLCLISLALVLAGCSGPRILMSTPNVHLESDRDFFETLDPSLKSTEVPLFYITDRALERDEEGKLAYGPGRSSSLAFGKVLVDLGRDATWEELVEASRTQQRVQPFVLEILEVEELVRSAETPLPFTEVDGRIVLRPDVAAQLVEAKEDFRRLLVEQLELTPRKEVFIYVHGFHNGFDDAVFAMAELWHFLGRIGVPVVYTWPAGHPGVFGYTYDRESSEFTVYHLRQVLELISSFSEVEKIHLIAHSRGTDVALNAIRELTLQARAADLDPRERFKVHNLILAAPDLDLQVSAERIVGDQLSLSVDRFTIYTSPKDKAIGVAARLFASPRGRLGTFGVEGIPDALAAVLEYSGANVAIVRFEGGDYQGDRFGHSYFRDAPAVSSDLILMLRDDLDPGPPGRPLRSLGKKFWRVPPGYPAVGPSDMPAARADRSTLTVH